LFLRKAFGKENDRQQRTTNGQIFIGGARSNKSNAMASIKTNWPRWKTGGKRLTIKVSRGTSEDKRCIASQGPTFSGI
jgi:hypothetical protein